MLAAGSVGPAATRFANDGMADRRRPDNHRVIHVERELLVGRRVVAVERRRIRAHDHGLAIGLELQQSHVALAAFGVELVIGEYLVDDVAVVAKRGSLSSAVAQHVAVEHELEVLVFLDELVPQLLAVVDAAGQILNAVRMWVPALARALGGPVVDRIVVVHVGVRHEDRVVIRDARSRPGRPTRPTASRGPHSSGKHQPILAVGIERVPGVVGLAGLERPADRRFAKRRACRARIYRRR